jgi:hypothetical protein
VVSYTPAIEGEGDQAQVVWESVECEQIDWKDFRMGPGRRWSEKPWVAFRYRLTRDQFDKAFPTMKSKDIRPDWIAEGKDKADERKVSDTFKRFTVWKIWDKETRQVHFLSPAYKESLLKSEPDPLKLQNFFPCPRPYYDIEDPNNTIPLVPFNMYRDQADELDRLTKRINGIIAVLRWRGVRSADITEFMDLSNAKDGELVASQNLNQIIKDGGIEKAVWLMPIDKAVVVLRELYVAREQIKQTIFEITGVADIMRGQTDPNETLGAQQIKAQWGSIRLQHRQAEVQRVARDLIRLKAEIIAEHFSPQTLSIMTGIKLPTQEEKQAAQQQMQILQQPPQQGQPPAPPEMMQGLEELLKQPTWDEVMAVIKSDGPRGYRIDIETDSTIQADVLRQQQSMTQFVQGSGQYFQAVAPAIQAGAMPMETAVKIYSSFARVFKLGRQVEDALDQLGQQAAQPQQPKPSPEEMALQAKQKETEMTLAAKQQETQMTLRAKQAESQMTMQQMQAQHQMEMEALAAKQMAEQQSNAIKMQAMQADTEFAREQHGMKREQMMMGADNDRAKARDERNTIAAKRMTEKGEATEEGPEPEDMLAGFLKTMQAMVETNQQIAQSIVTLVQSQSQPKTMTVKKGANGTWTGESRVLQ